MHDLQKHVAILLCFLILVWKISWFFCLILLVSVQKKNTFKKKVTLFIFSLDFLLNLFSFLSYLYVYSPCCYSSHSPRFFSFFLFLFSLSMFPLLMFPLLKFASRYVYLLSLSLSLLSFLWLFFFEKSPLFIFWKKKNLVFSFVRPFFVKLFLFYLLCCFAPFSFCFCFFQSCSFEQDKLTSFFWQKNTCLIPPRTYFLIFL